MNLRTKDQLARDLQVHPKTIAAHVRAGTLPAPVVGVFPRDGLGQPKANERAMWDLDACLKAWGRPTE